MAHRIETGGLRVCTQMRIEIRVAVARLSFDDAMMRGGERMTTSELKRAMDRRFDRLERTTGRLQRTKSDKAELRRAVTRVRRGVAASAGNTQRRLRQEIAASAKETRGYVDRFAHTLRDEIAELGRVLRQEIAETRSDVARLRIDVDSLKELIAASAAETRRHFEIVVKDASKDFRGYGDGIIDHTKKLANHEARITKLEQRSIGHL